MPLVQLVASPVGAMDATGSGTIESQEHTASAHTNLTHEFRIELSKTSALFSAFSWADVDTEGNVDAAAGQTDFTITLDESAFAAALKSVIEQAVGGKVSGGFDISTTIAATIPGAQTVADPSNLGSGSRIAETVLDREIRLEVEAELDANGVLEYLEGDSLNDFALALDASGGAADMASKMNVTSVLRNLFLQIPNRTSEIAETDASGSRLPVAVGDALAFVFNVQPSVTISQTTESADSGNNANGAVSASAEDLATGNMALGGTALSTGVRKIAFVIDVVA